MADPEVLRRRQEGAARRTEGAAWTSQTVGPAGDDNQVETP